MKTLKQRVEDEARRLEEARAKAVDSTAELVKRWDALALPIEPTYYSGATGIYGQQASLSFAEVPPDDVVTLMKALPAVPGQAYVDGCTYTHPHGARELKEGQVWSGFDGYELRLQTIQWKRNFSLSWYCDLDGLRIHVRVEPAQLDLHPFVNRKWVVYANDMGRYEGPSVLAWPKGEDCARVNNEAWAKAQGTTRIFVGGGDQSTGQASLIAKDMVVLFQAWAEECDRRGTLTRAAFERCLAATNMTRMPTPEDIDKAAQVIKASYYAEKFRAGTLEQAACLATPMAVVDKFVAENHWQRYCEHYDIEGRENYFNHYTWACSFLARCDLLVVPWKDKDGNPIQYKYGAGWL